MNPLGPKKISRKTIAPTAPLVLAFGFFDRQRRQERDARGSGPAGQEGRDLELDHVAEARRVLRGADQDERQRSSPPARIRGPGAPKKNPSVTASGESGETRWKSRMPDSRAPPTAAETCVAPMIPSVIVWIARKRPEGPAVGVPVDLTWHAVGRPEADRPDHDRRRRNHCARRSRDRTCLTNSGLSTHIAIVLMTGTSRRAAQGSCWPRTLGDRGWPWAPHAGCNPAGCAGPRSEPASGDLLGADLEEERPPAPRASGRTRRRGPRRGRASASRSAAASGPPSKRNS